MHLERVEQRQRQLSDERCIARERLQDRVDQHRLARTLVGGEIRVRGGAKIDELSEDHGCLGGAGALTLRSRRGLPAADLLRGSSAC